MTLQVIEYPTKGYKDRTIFNATNADLTIAMTLDASTSGEKLTRKAAGDNYTHIDLNVYGELDLLVYELGSTLFQWDPKVVNFAGNSIYHFPFDQPQLNNLIYKAFYNCDDLLQVELVRTGGQTGIDLAAAVACHKLGIPVIVTMPSGCPMRWRRGLDVSNDPYDVEQMIIEFGENLNDVEHI